MTSFYKLEMAVFTRTSQSHPCSGRYARILASTQVDGRESLSTMEPMKLSPDDSIWINDDIIELDEGTSICGSLSCEEISVQADSESTNPHHKNITRNVSGEKCDCANAASGEVHTHRIEPRCNGQWKFAESDTATS